MYVRMMCVCCHTTGFSPPAPEKCVLIHNCQPVVIIKAALLYIIPLSQPCCSMFFIRTPRPTKQSHHQSLIMLLPLLLLAVVLWRKEEGRIQQPAWQQEREQEQQYAVCAAPQFVVISTKVQSSSQGSSGRVKLEVLNDDCACFRFLRQHRGGSRTPCFPRLWLDCHKAFSGSCVCLLLRKQQTPSNSDFCY